jgi:hypothetical protein
MGQENLWTHCSLLYCIFSGYLKAQDTIHE